MPASGSQPATEAATRRHHALGAASRVRILEALRTAPVGLDAREAAGQVGLHHTTVRSHLELLVEAGLATRSAEERVVPGRPRVVFRAAEDEGGGPAPRYEFLAKILTSYLAGATEDPVAAATDLGRAWGGSLIERRAPFDGASSQEAISPQEAVRRVVDEFAGLGFQPELVADHQGERMLLRRCPFHELALARPDVICSIHLGLLRGALAELGAPVTATRLLAFVEPSLCVAYLEPTAQAASGVR